MQSLQGFMQGSDQGKDTYVRCIPQVKVQPGENPRKQTTRQQFQSFLPRKPETFFAL